MVVQTKAQVKAIQTSLNAKGANLKVDGIAGRLTNAAIARYGGGSTKVSNVKSTTSGNNGNGATNKPTILNRSGSTQNTSYNKSSGSGKSFLGSIFSGAKKYAKNVSGGAGIVSGGIKDAINTVGKDVFKNNMASADGSDSMNFPLLDTRVNPVTGYTESVTPSTLINGYSGPTTFSGRELASGGLGVNSNVGQAVKGISTKLNTAFADGYSPATESTSNRLVQPNTLSNQTNSQTADLSLGMASDTPLSGNMVADSGVTPVDTTPVPAPVPTSVVEKTTTPNSDGSTTTLTSNLAQATTTPIYNSNSANLTSQLGNLNAGLKDTSGTSYMSSNSKSEFQNNKVLNYATNSAKVFNTPEEATAYFNSPEGQTSSADYVAKGGKIQDIISKVTPVTNGVTEPKTTADFLSYNKNIDKSKTNAFNEQIALESNWSQQQKDILLGKKDAQGNDILLGLAEKQKQEQNTYINYYTEKINNERTSSREKAQYSIDKARAEFESRDAETEINRQNAKANLTEFLAKIGALRTDGNALTGLEKLEQAYQAQRQSLKNNFNLTEREIRMNMNDRMNQLESSLDDKKFTLSQDLSKTEREVAMDVGKLEYQHKKDMLNIKIKYSDEIQSAKNKIDSKSNKASSDWTNAYLTISGADMFKALPAEFRNQWLQNNPINSQGFKTTQVDLAKDYANWSKNKSSNKNYTSANIPNTIQTSLQEDISSGAPLNELIKLYPEISTSYLNSFYNQTKK